MNIAQLHGKEIFDLILSKNNMKCINTIIEK